MSGHEVPTGECVECGARDREEHPAWCPATAPAPRSVAGLGARYVAVKYSATFFEARAKRWRSAALLGWSLATALAVALGVVILG